MHADCGRPCGDPERGARRRRGVAGPEERGDQSDDRRDRDTQRGRLQIGRAECGEHQHARHRQHHPARRDHFFTGATSTISSTAEPTGGSAALPRTEPYGANADAGHRFHDAVGVLTNPINVPVTSAANGPSGPTWRAPCRPIRPIPLFTPGIRIEHCLRRRYLPPLAVLRPRNVHGDPPADERWPRRTAGMHLLRVALESQQDAREVEFAAAGVEFQQRFVCLHSARTRGQVFERLAEHVHATRHGERARALVDDDAPDLKTVLAKRLQLARWRRGGRLGRAPARASARAPADCTSPPPTPSRASSQRRQFMA